MSLNPNIRSLLAAAMLLTVTAGVAKAAGCHQSAAEDKAAIRSVLASYQDALNGSDTDAVMPPYSRSAVGKPAVRQAYDDVFKNIVLHVKFNIAELVEMSPNWAFVRTNSAGTNKVDATGATSAEANQELFIFHKGNDCGWKIARYSFSTTNSPPKP